MSFRHGHQYPAAPERGLDIEELARRLAQGVNGILDGQTNNVLAVTLDPGETVTEFIEPRVKPGTAIMLSPQTLSAAASVATTYAVAGVGVISVHHSADAAEDRTFGVVFFGAGAA